MTVELPVTMSEPILSEEGFGVGFRIFHPPGVACVFPADTHQCSCGKINVEAPEAADVTPVSSAEPASTVFSGYKRSTRTTGQLIAALSAVLYAFPNERLGQLLDNLAGPTEPRNIYDEEWIGRLTERLEEG